MDSAQSSTSAWRTQAIQEDIAIIGGGNWGSAVAKKIGQNLKQQNDRITEHDIITYEIVSQPKRQGLVMWTKEEQVNGRSLTDIINETHENVKYLPGPNFLVDAVLTDFFRVL
jgi:glycerol-3-phosphate dehydrogenase (NAD+)